MAQQFQLATTDEHLKFEPAFTKWWAKYRIAHHLYTVPYHLELAARIAALEAWIAARKRKPTRKSKPNG